VIELKTFSGGSPCSLSFCTWLNDLHSKAEMFMLC